MTSENEPKTKIMTKVVVGVLLSLGTAGFIFADIGQYIRPSSNEILAKIGTDHIKRVDVLQERDTLSKQLSNIPLNAFIQRKLLTQSFENLALRTAITEYAQSIGITAADSEIADNMVSIDIFHDASGNFDKKLFKKLLKNQKMSVSAFKKNISNHIIQSHFIQSANTPFPLPKKIHNTINHISNAHIDFSVHAIDYANVPQAIIDKNPIDNKTLQALYKENSKQLKYPELKDVTYVMFNPQQINNKIKISASDINQYYIDNKARLYTKPEEREIYQIITEDAQEAKKIFKKINAHENFQEAAKKNGYILDDINLGFVDKNYFSSEDTQKIVFDAPLNKTLPPIKAEFGYTIYYVNQVKPEQVKSFEMVQDAIKDKLSYQQKNQYLLSIFSKVDDDLAGGANFQEIVKKYGSKISIQKNIMRNGMIYNKDSQNTEIFNKNIPLDYINNYNVNDEIPIIELEKNNFALVKVIHQTPERPLTFEEAKADLIKINNNKVKKNTLSKIITDINKNNLSDTILEKYNATSKTYQLKRTDQIPSDIEHPTLKNLLFTNDDQEQLSFIKEDTAYFVKVNAIKQPEKTENLPENHNKNMYDTLEVTYHTQIQDQIFDKVYKQVPIEIKHDAFKDFMSIEDNF